MTKNVGTITYEVNIKNADIFKEQIGISPLRLAVAKPLIWLAAKLLNRDAVIEYELKEKL